jgi:hypothetical protein
MPKKVLNRRRTRKLKRRSRRQRGGARITVNYTTDGTDKAQDFEITDTSNHRELETKVKAFLSSLPTPVLFKRFRNVVNMNSPLTLTILKAEIVSKELPALLARALIGTDITTIGKEKPVATLNAGNNTHFNSNWPLYTEAEKAIVLKILKKQIGYEIGVRYVVSSGYIFYSVPHLTVLCGLFDDKSIEQCFQAYFPPSPEPSEAFDFIYLAFGDIFKPEGHMDKKTEADLTAAGRAKLQEYMSYPDELFGSNESKLEGGGGTTSTSKQ